MIDQPLEVFGEAAVATEPAEDPLNHPAPWNDLETLGMRRSFDDFQPKPGSNCMAGGDGALIASIGKQASQPGELAFDPTVGLGQAIAILDVGGMGDQVQRQADCVGDQMALSTVDLISRIVAAQPAGFRGFDALAIDHARRR